MRHQNNYRKSGNRKRRLFDIDVYDPRKDSFQRRFTHKGLSWEEVEWIKFHPHLRVTSIKPSEAGERRYNNKRKSPGRSRQDSSTNQG